MPPTDADIGKLTTTRMATDSGKFALMQSLDDKAKSILEPTQSSESSGTRDQCGVCLKCGVAFILHGDEISAHCPCDHAMMTRSNGRVAFNQFTHNITPLLQCGKLSAHELPTGTVVLAAHNKALAGRHESEPPAKERVSAVGKSITDIVGTAFTYMQNAGKAGASVTFTAHYHTMPTGISRAEDGDYVTRANTGAARYVGQVLLDVSHDEKDGSIVYHPVFGCARCGQDHHQRIAFWRLIKPVQEFDPLTVGNWRTQATHFGFCPSNGEPILMMCSQTPDVEDAVGAVAPPTEPQSQP